MIKAAIILVAYITLMYIAFRLDEVRNRKAEPPARDLRYLPHRVEDWKGGK